MTMTAFGRRMNERNFERETRRDGVVRLGIGLKANPEQPQPPAETWTSAPSVLRNEGLL